MTAGTRNEKKPAPERPAAAGSQEAGFLVPDVHRLPARRSDACVALDVNRPAERRQGGFLDTLGQGGMGVDRGGHIVQRRLDGLPEADLGN